MINALAACEHLLIPVQTEFLALKGLERMLHTLSMVTQSHSSPLPHTIIPTMFDRRTRASIDTLRVLRERYPSIMWGNVVPVDTQFREASRKGVPISKLHQDGRGLNAYKKLLEELLLSEGTAESTPKEKVMYL
jgi:chromosome partitioning protein